MSKQPIKKYHLEQGKADHPDFGFHTFSNLKNANLCLNQEPHNHSFYQIIFFKKTRAKHFIDFNAYPVEPDSLIFVAKNQVHFFEQGVTYDGFLIHFNEAFLISSETDINFFLTYHLFNNKEKPFFKIPKELQPPVNIYFEQIHAELQNTEEFGNTSILSNLLKSLLLIVEREIRKGYQEDERKTIPNPVFLTFRNLLETNFKKGWSVSQYADSLNISTKTLNAVIKKESDQTASQFITDRIILESKRQLSHTNILINEIAYDLGFQDPYYFMKFFKKQVGHTPKDFRQSISQFS